MSISFSDTIIPVQPGELQDRNPWCVGDQPKFTAQWTCEQAGGCTGDRFIFKTDAWRYPLGLLTEQLLQVLYKACGISVPDSYLVSIEQELWLASRWFVTPGKSYTSGTEVLGSVMGGAEAVRMLERNQATRSSISVVLTESALIHGCGSRQAGRIYQEWIRMVMMDALVGNTDRSPENWGLLYHIESGTWELAPVFDTSRALLYQQEDSFLEGMEVGSKRARKWLESYCQGSLPKVCFEQGKVITHFQLAQSLQVVLPKEVESWWKNLMTREGWNVIEATVMGFQSLVSPNRLLWWLLVLKYRFTILQKGLSKA